MWNCCAAALRAWGAYAARVGTWFLPADEGHFANLLAAAVPALGYSQAKQRACAIAALGELARCPSPSADTAATEVRAGVRRSRRCRRCGARRSSPWRSRRLVGCSRPRAA